MTNTKDTAPPDAAEARDEAYPMPSRFYDVMHQVWAVLLQAGNQGNATYKWTAEPYEPIWNDGFDAGIEHERAGSGWVAVSDRLPDDDIDVLVSVDGEDVFKAYNVGGVFYHSHNGKNVLGNVTAWRHLPEPHQQPAANGEEVNDAAND